LEPNHLRYIDFGGLRPFEEFSNFPDVITDPRRHRGCRPQRPVDTAEVVVGEPESHGRPMVLPLPAECVRQSGKPPHTHADVEIVALHNRCADSGRIGLPTDWDHLDGSDFCEAVARFAFAVGAVDLDELGVAGDLVFERRGDRRAVRSKAVRADLEFAPASRVPDVPGIPTLCTCPRTTRRESMPRQELPYYHARRCGSGYQALLA
jgi:hypothetical protein